MSLQDDIFDVRHALKSKPESKSFERIEEAFSRAERGFEDANARLRDIRAGIRAMKSLVGEV